jgi:molybdopterin-guanine dinucleotide biosynthesis protein A
MLSLALLSGGKSTRMGQDKALMSFLGRPLIQHILERLAPLVDEVLLSTNRPADYAFLSLQMQADIHPDCGALGGLYTMLNSAQNPMVAAVACDMPFANPELFEYEKELLTKSGADVVIPSTLEGLEPLHAVYLRENCLPVIRSAIEAGKLKLTGWLTEVNVRLVPPEEIALFDPCGLAFWNINTPEEFRLAEEQAKIEEI